MVKVTLQQRCSSFGFLEGRDPPQHPKLADHQLKPASPKALKPLPGSLAARAWHRLGLGHKGVLEIQDMKNICSYRASYVDEYVFYACQF